jgi:hypothetical protein
MKKSFYILLSAILGMLLFLMLDRIAVFFYLFLIAGGFISANINFAAFAVLDYFFSLLFCLLGAWYGIWLGLYWFRRVYEEGSHGGVIDHITKNYFFPHPPKQLDTKISAVRERLEKDLWQLEDLATETLVRTVSPKPIKRRIVRKKAPKKLKSAT